MKYIACYNGRYDEYLTKQKINEIEISPIFKRMNMMDVFCLDKDSLQGILLKIVV